MTCMCFNILSGFMEFGELWYASSFCHSMCVVYLFAGRVCDAVELAGRNVMSTSSVVTTGLVSQR